MPPDSPEPGRVITFYSYKGGTGRTMALANVACLLAQDPLTGPVLTVDWDLEAPGLHRFLPPRLNQTWHGGLDLGLDDTPGIIDLFIALRDALPAVAPRSEEEAEAAVETAFARIRLDDYVSDTYVPNVRMLRAGRNDDGLYSRRVGKFDWEGLFQRAPGIYRALGERLAANYRSVLVDSRTGVTDTSGICTYLLPESLVVVFTPNRQSLTGIRELVERATEYRRRSDDIRPLVIYPLPSRIEASLQGMRTRWRFGDRDRNIIGYQPMFETLLRTAYALPVCDLSKYFDEVQIQQTPDFAYGEEIAVRRTGDRFSMASSYTVFVRRLMSGDPPWVQPVSDPGTGPLSIPTAAEPSSGPISMTASGSGWATTRAARPAEADWTIVAPQPLSGRSQTSTVSDSQTVRTTERQLVYISSANEDRERVGAIAETLRARGLEVWDRQSTGPDRSRQDAVADALDRSEAIVVCWSRASVESRWVSSEAEEGLRRGILVPALIDDVSPPLAFRSVQAADLRRPTADGLARFADAVERIAKASPGTISYPASVLPVSSPAALATWMWSASTLQMAIGAAAVAIGIVGGMAWAFASRGTSDRTAPSATVAQMVTVPNFVDASSIDVEKVAELIGLTLIMSDGKGARAPYLDGIVTKQTPSPGASVEKSTRIELTVATNTVTVPPLVGNTLDAALATLEQHRLRLGEASSTTVAATTSGPATIPATVLRQSPDAGSVVREGTRVNLVVAGGRPQPPPPAQRPSQQRPATGRGRR